MAQGRVPLLPPLRNKSVSATWTPPVKQDCFTLQNWGVTIFCRYYRF
ncbi:hypothetical protein PLAN_70037 [Planktothrix rubescens CCAP 1459/22]|uniref:Uncharacterized protein n=1 Tax=Planktothrix rubescens CCAP 1459/22 TaxID=329571 RepID=A0A6J7ZSX1_PLARU|nr:hypothetical protein PLAN_70037 [Planktothrix rubescens NIVA-CYA 18]CAD0232965.1 conserved hypothetical protein [Planktothrix agardhii]